MDSQRLPDALKVRAWNSIPVRLGLAVLVLILAAAGVGLVTIARQEARRTIEKDTDHARVMSAIIADDLASLMQTGGGPAVWAGVSAAAVQHASLIDATRILVVTKAGVVKAGSDTTNLDNRVAMTDAAECPRCDSARDEDFPAAAMLFTPEGGQSLRVVNKVPVSLACLQCHTSVEAAKSFVLVDFDLTPLERGMRRRQLTTFGLGLVVALAVAALIILLFRRMVMRPADMLTASMERLANGELAARTPVLAPNELGVLASHFNHMAGQIAEQVARIEAARTESALLYTLVVEASKKLETKEFAEGVSRVIHEKLRSRHTAFFLETGSSGWICAAAGSEAGQVLVEGTGELETVVSSDTAQLQQLLDGMGPEFARLACRTRKLQLTRETGELTIALPVVVQGQLVGLLACVGIAAGLVVDQDLLTNLGAHLTLAAVNSRNYTGAITDGLTQLRNKQYGIVRLQEAVSAARRYGSALALAMCDIDHFKRVNDSFGHPTGDAVLREVSRRIAACIRQSDIAVRYGGEEFMLILIGADPIALASIGEKIRQTVAGLPIALNDEGNGLAITLSVGIAACRPGADSADSLIARADQMLYRAKENGRNRVEMEV